MRRETERDRIAAAWPGRRLCPCRPAARQHEPHGRPGGRHRRARQGHDRDHGRRRHRHPDEQAGGDRLAQLLHRRRRDRPFPAAICTLAGGQPGHRRRSLDDQRQPPGQWPRDAEQPRRHHLRPECQGRRRRPRRHHGPACRPRPRRRLRRRPVPLRGRPARLLRRQRGRHHRRRSRPRGPGRTLGRQPRQDHCSCRHRAARLGLGLHGRLLRRRAVQDRRRQPDGDRARCGARRARGARRPVG